jgi:hypothetical protein
VGFGPSIDLGRCRRFGPDLAVEGRPLTFEYESLAKSIDGVHVHAQGVGDLVAGEATAGTVASLSNRTRAWRTLPTGADPTRVIDSNRSRCWELRTTGYWFGVERAIGRPPCHTSGISIVREQL